MSIHLEKVKKVAGSKRILLNFLGYKSIRSARIDIEGSDTEIYNYLKYLYNETIETINKDISETASKDSTTLEANLYDIVPTIEDDLVDLEHDHRASHEYKKNRRIDEETEKKVIIQKEFFKVYWLLAWLNFTSRGVLRVFEVMSPHALLTTYNLSEIQTGLVVTIAI
jgi:hypothetical protein